MNNKNKHIIIFIYCFFVLITYKTVAQDLHFSQYFEQTPLRNPALAGLFEGDLKLSGNYRNQWRSVTRFPFSTTAASVEIKFPIGRNENAWITTGLQTVHDQAGEAKLTRFHILPFANLYRRINETQWVSAGVIAGWAASQFDITKLRLGDQWVNGFYNPGNPTAQTFNRTTTGYFDVGAGVSFVSGTEETDNQMYAGVSVFHINRPNVNFYAAASDSRLPIKYVANAGFSLFTGDESRLTFHGDVYKQGQYNEIILTTLYTVLRAVDAQASDRNSFSFGIMYRHKDAVIPVFQLKHWSGLKFGVSYDANVSQLRTGSNLRGGFEFNMSKTFSLRSREGLPCPYFQF